MRNRLFLYLIFFSISFFAGIVNNAEADASQQAPLRYELFLDKEARYVHELPQSEEEWNLIFKETGNLYRLSTEYFAGLFTVAGMAIKQSSISQLCFGGLLILLWWLITYGITRLVHQSTQLHSSPTTIKNFTGKLGYYLAQLWRRNIGIIVAFGTIVLTLLYFEVSNVALLFSLLGVIFFTKLEINIARIALVENLTDDAGRDVRLYQIFKWAFIIAGVLLALTISGHYLSISVYMVGFVDRALLLVILLFSIALLKNWRVIPSLVKPYIQRRYLQRSISVLSALIPLVLMSTAIIGLVGYVVLAWRIGGAELKLLGVIVCWIVIRGVISDIMLWLSGLLIREVRNGWLWTEAILKPLRNVLNILIFLFIIVLLFWVYGLQPSSTLIKNLQAGFQYPLFTIGGSDITATKLILFSMILAIIIWMAKWSREFSYRWLFSGTKDYGLRNTFAVFTQYTAVFIGSIIVLKVLGIDLTTLTVVLGALSLGIGIGLQNLANSLVSGLILLIERPLQVGDLVKIGEHEGEVTRVGMRSITVNSWDHKEVIVPNADTLSQPVVNWTHRDNVIRIDTRIRVGFDQDPHKVREIIVDVLKTHAGILSEPLYEVFIIELGETAIVFEIRFYIDLRSRYTTSFSAARSAVLFDIWDALQRNHIHMPYPQQVVKVLDHERRGD